MSDRIFTAALRGQLKSLEKLLEEGVDPNTVNEVGYTPTMAAAHDGRVDCLKLLISTGANVNLADDSGRTALINAVQHSTVETVRLLLDQGSNVNHQTELGHSPLMHVPFNNYPPTDCVELAGLLIENGADIRATDKTGKTALDFAKSKSREDLFEILST